MIWSAKNRQRRRRNRTDAVALDAAAALPESHDSRFARRMIWIIFAGLFAVLLWAGNTPVKEVTSGQGTIVTQANVEVVEHPDGGLVAAIAAVEGQSVEVGETLVTLDTGTLERELAKLSVTRDALLAERARVDLILDGERRAEALTPQDGTTRTLLFWAEVAYLDAQLDILDADRGALDAAIGVLVAREANLTREATILRSRLSRSRGAQSRGTLAETEIETQERALLQTERQLLEVAGDLSNQRSAQEGIDLRRAELIAARRREAALRKAEVEEQIANAELTISELEARLMRSSIVATVDGILMTLAVSNPNEVVAPNELIAEIVPANGDMKAEIEISADRIGNIDPGMEARLKVLTYDFTRFGEIIGVVSAISPTSFLNERGEAVYRVTVEMSHADNGAALSGRPLRPGMTVAADILTDQKMVLAYLLKPLRALRDRAFTEA